jgi:hypothetical protein
VSDGSGPDRIAVDHWLAALILKQIYRVGRVVPEEVIGPAARLAGCIDVGTPEEVRLHVHLQDRQTALLYPFVNPLVTWIEPAHVPGHGDDACFLLDC